MHAHFYLMPKVIILMDYECQKFLRAFDAQGAP